MPSNAPSQPKNAAGDTETLSLLDLVRGRLATGVVVVGPEGRIDAICPEAEYLIGRAAAQVLHHTVDALPEPLGKAIQHSRDSGLPLRDAEVVVNSEPGRNRVLCVSTMLTGEKAGRTTVALLSDQNKTRRVEMQIEQLDRVASIGTLAAGMAHEIKNAMVAIKTFLELLLKHNQDAELATVVSREMRRIDSIVSQMLRFAGPARPTFAYLHVNEIIEQSLRLVQHQLEGKRIVLRRQFDAGSDLVRGDAYQLQQALLNLLLNALEAMGRDGQLTVATALLGPSPSVVAALGASAPDELHIAITDTGPGIPPENRERLFEPFFTTKPNGTGLGLSITQRILVEHAGRIDIQSAVNQGTTFTIVLPAVRPRSRSSPAPAAGAAAPS